MNFIKQGDTVRLFFSTRDPSTGASVNAAALPTCAIYVNGITFGAPGATVTNKSTGVYEVAVACTAGNGYAVGDDVNVVVQCTVNPASGSPTFGAGSIAEFRVSARDVDDLAEKSIIDSINGRVPAALVSGRMDVSVGAMATDTLTASALAANAVTEIQTGLATAASVSVLATAAQVSTLQADTDDIQTRLPTALVSGRMNASVGAVAADAITAASIATDAIDADALAASAIAELATAVWAQVIESSQTAANMMRGFAATLFGKVSDFSGGTLVFRDLADTKNRITVVTGATGRTSSTVNDLT